MQQLRFCPYKPAQRDLRDRTTRKQHKKDDNHPRPGPASPSQSFPSSLSSSSSSSNHVASNETDNDHHHGAEEGEGRGSLVHHNEAHIKAVQEDEERLKTTEPRKPTNKIQIGSCKERERTEMEQKRKGIRTKIKKRQKM